MTAYADADDLTAQLSDAYTAPEDPSKLLADASELIDQFTIGRSAVAWAAGDMVAIAAITRATCKQVEFWLEVGEEHDVTGLKGSLVGGRVQMHPVAPVLGPRTKRILLAAGLLQRGVDQK